MAHLVQQDGAKPMPNSNLRTLEITERSELEFLDVEFEHAPHSLIVVIGTFPRTGPHPRELTELLRSIKQQTGVRYCWIKPLCEEYTRFDLNLATHGPSEVVKTIVWLGPSADDSDAAIRCLARLHERTPSISLRRLWSRREGQALLALAERPVWRYLSPEVLAEVHEPWLYCGKSGVSWDAVLHFREILSDLAIQGRMEHHQFAHAILGSQASNVIETTASIQEGVYAVDNHEFPPPLRHATEPSDPSQDMDVLSSQLDKSISVVETRWVMLNHHVQPQNVPEIVSESDLDAEIAKYTQLLQQIDVLEADLGVLDGLTTQIRCRQYEARTPRGSPEIAP